MPSRPSMRPSFRPEGAELLKDEKDRERRCGAVAQPVPPNTTVLQKSVIESDEPADDLEGSEVRVVKAARGDTLARILVKAGADGWQARAMAEAARSIFPDNAIWRRAWRCTSPWCPR